MSPRTIRRFAWLPVLAGVHWLWLEWYEADQVWIDDASGMAGARWMTTARRPAR